jgi:hypothetical protein
MPGKLPASESLLNAIFAHTNLLGHDDRQVIIRFLAGEDLRMNSSENQRTSGSSQAVQSSSGPVPALRSQAINDDTSNIVSASITSQEDEDNSNYFTHFRHGRNGSSDTQNASGSGRQNLASSSSHPPTHATSSHRSILLHEERRTETRPRRNRASSHSGSNGTATIDLNGNAPGDENDDPEMKTYTIIDQIIFEMDYMSGCWRKLRRRMRMSEKRTSETSNSSGLFSNSAATDRRRTRLRSGPFTQMNNNGEDIDRNITSPRRENAILSRFRSHIASINSASSSTNSRTRGFGRRRSSLLRTPAIVYSPPVSQIDDTIELADNGILQNLDDSQSGSDSVSSGQESSHGFESETDSDTDDNNQFEMENYYDPAAESLYRSRANSEVIFERTQPVSGNHWLTITGRRISHSGIEFYEALNPATGNLGAVRGYQSALGQGQ